MQVWLPASRELVFLSGHEAEKNSSVASRQENKSPGCVLVIDDEEDVMHVARRMLEHLGMVVLSARDGVEGLEIYRARKSEIDWVLLDMTMPNMNGSECLLHLADINSDVYVVMSSGYNQEPDALELAHKHPQGFLKKPYTLARLKEVSDKAMAAG
jgi:CheY-like chemotaxis protein